MCLIQLAVDDAAGLLNLLRLRTRPQPAPKSVWGEWAVKCERSRHMKVLTYRVAGEAGLWPTFANRWGVVVLLLFLAADQRRRTRHHCRSFANRTSPPRLGFRRADPRPN